MTMKGGVYAFSVVFILMLIMSVSFVSAGYFVIFLEGLFVMILEGN